MLQKKYYSEPKVIYIIDYPKLAMGFFNFQKKTVIITIIFFMIAFMFLSIASCPKIQMVCPATKNTPNAHIDPINNNKYYTNALYVPLSCSQVCSKKEYNSKLIIAILQNIILPIIISYVLACGVLFLYRLRNR